MNIVVCVKQVPEITKVVIDPATKTLVRKGVPSILNPFDEFAVEEALRIREKHGGEVVAITMGPPQVREVVLKCLAMGIDRAIQLTDKAFAGADTLATAYALAQAIKKFVPDFSIILCGKEAIDSATAQVPPELSELLGIPLIGGIKKVEVNAENGTAIAHRENEDGYEVVECKLPVLLTAIKGLNELRLPTIMGIMTAKRKEIKVVKAADLQGDPDLFGLSGSPTQVREVFTPKPRAGGIVIRDRDPVEASRKLVQFLVDKKVIEV